MRGSREKMIRERDRGGEFLPLSGAHGSVELAGWRSDDTKMVHLTNALKGSRRTSGITRRKNTAVATATINEQSFQIMRLGCRIGSRGQESTIPRTAPPRIRVIARSVTKVQSPLFTQRTKNGRQKRQPSRMTGRTASVVDKSNQSQQPATTHSNAGTLRFIMVS